MSVNEQTDALCLVTLISLNEEHHMLRNLKDIELCTITATDGDIGQVKDLYFDDQSWVVRYLVVETGSWLSSRKVLVSPISIEKADGSPHTIRVRITQEQVEKSPDIDTEKPVSRQHEVQFLGYYGYPGYWGGSSLWGSGMVPMATYSGYAGMPGGVDEEEKTAEGDPHLRSCEAVIGYHIKATDGEVGHVDEIIIDEETWAVRYLVVNTSNWWVGHKVLIAPQWIEAVNWSDQTVTVDLTRESVKEAPPYDATQVVKRPSESSLYSHYGRPPYWAAASTLEREI